MLSHYPNAQSHSRTGEETTESKRRSMVPTLAMDSSSSWWSMVDAFRSSSPRRPEVMGRPIAAPGALRRRWAGRGYHPVERELCRPLTRERRSLAVDLGLGKQAVVELAHGSVGLARGRHRSSAGHQGWPRCPPAWRKAS
jgi:hypothetical protein